MLTLLKQARAFGLGCVLATQNPVDLDYKGLANCGTWFIGRLQTERDKLRVIEGPQVRAGRRRRHQSRIADVNLTQRVFLMRNVHEDAPVLMKTRWALSFLRGPLTGPEITRAMGERKSAAASISAASATTPTSAPAATPGAGARPPVGAGITEYFLAADHGQWPGVVQAHDRGLCQVALCRCEARSRRLGNQRLAGAARRRRWQCVVGDATSDSQLKSRLTTAPASAAGFADIPGSALRAASYAGWAKSLQARLYETARARVLNCDTFKFASKPGESEGDFRARLALAAREKRDASVAELRKKWQAKLLQLQDQVRRAEERRAREQSQLSQQKMQTAMTIGTSILGALLGRQGHLRDQYRAHRHRGAFGHAHRPRIRGRDACRMRAWNVLRHGSPTRSATWKPKLRAGNHAGSGHTGAHASRGAGAQVRHRGGRSRAGVGAVAQGRRWLSGAGILRGRHERADRQVDRRPGRECAPGRGWRRGAVQGREGQARRREFDSCWAGVPGSPIS
jgi:hypothetical protein